MRLFTEGFPKSETGAFAPFIYSFIFYFYLFFIFARCPRSQSRGYFPQPVITQLGHPRSQIRGFFLSQSKITQQGLLPISNWGIFSLSAQDNTARAAPDHKSGNLDAVYWNFNILWLTHFLDHYKFPVDWVIIFYGNNWFRPLSIPRQLSFAQGPRGGALPGTLDTVVIPTLCDLPGGISLDHFNEGFWSRVWGSRPREWRIAVSITGTTTSTPYVVLVTSRKWYHFPEWSAWYFSLNIRLVVGGSLLPGQCIVAVLALWGFVAAPLAVNPIQAMLQSCMYMYMYICTYIYIFQINSLILEECGPGLGEIRTMSNLDIIQTELNCLT